MKFEYNKKNYKVWAEVDSDREQVNAWRTLVEMGYNGEDIYQFNYWGNDDKFHREIYVFA